MLSLSQPLYFPKLVHVGEATFKAWTDTKKKTNLYKLDWSKSENFKRSNFNDWAKRHKGISQYIGDLPEEYDEWLKDFTFAIPSHYMFRITDFSQKALAGWCARYPFDTAIRELCLKPAISYIEVAFKLIADCPYDKETNYFYRKDDKILIAHAALYKFWSFQTGRGLVEDHADFNRLEFISKMKGALAPPDKYRAAVIDFLNSIKEHQKALEKVYERVCIEKNPTGPSLGEKTASTASNWRGASLGNTTSSNADNTTIYFSKGGNETESKA